jgi:hypothetical protein
MDREYWHAERVIGRGTEIRGAGRKEGTRIYIERAMSKSGVKIMTGIVRNIV